jgi:hypothetical protein
VRWSFPLQHDLPQTRRRRSHRPNRNAASSLLFSVNDLMWVDIESFLALMSDVITCQLS